MFLLWARVVWAVRLTRALGPFVKSLTRLLPDFLLFMTLFTLMIAMFACVANLMFLQHNDVFATLPSSARLLFQASLGAFDFTLSDAIEYQIFLVIFLLFNVVFFFNLLIAVFSNSYSRHE